MATQQPQNALIFIPDISGFTKFVNETEILHSQHIIHELLESIINSNILGLSVSEIEGDAVLFYRTGSIPTPTELSEQVKIMFINFHKQLKIIDRDRVCHCGSCSTAINLTLKFLAHSGDISISKIRKHEQLIGKDVIIAHRLLKNNIESNEYFLLSEKYLIEQNSKNIDRIFDWAEKQSSVNNYDHIGQINYDYILLSPLRKLVPEIPQNDNIIKYPDPIIVKIFIKSQIEFIYNTIINLKLRKEWSNGLIKIDYSEDEIPHIGAIHNCELQTGSFELETVHKEQTKTKLEYAERANNNKLFPNSTTLFIVEKNNNGSDLTIKFSYKRYPVVGYLIDLMGRKKIEKNISISALNLKKYCEQNLQD